MTTSSSLPSNATAALLLIPLLMPQGAMGHRVAADKYPLFVKHQKQPVSAKAAVRAWRIE